MKSANGKHWLAMGILLACSSSQGMGFIISKAALFYQASIVPDENSWFLGALNLAPRFLIGLLALVAIYGPSVLRLSRNEWRQAVIMGLCSFCGCMFQIDGLQHTSGSVTAFFTLFSVVLIPIWAALLTKRWPRWPVWLAVGLITLGLSLLADLSLNDLRLGRGETELLIGAGFFSLMLFSINLPGFAGNRSQRAGAGMFLIEVVLLVLLAMATRGSEIGFSVPLVSVSWWGWVFLVSLLSTIGPFLLILHWQRFVSVTEAGMIYGLTPVFTMITGLFLPAVLMQWTGVFYENEIVTATVLAGGILVIAANVVMQLFHRSTPQTTVSLSARSAGPEC